MATPLTRFLLYFFHTFFFNDKNIRKGFNSYFAQDVRIANTIGQVDGIADLDSGEEEESEHTEVLCFPFLLMSCIQLEFSNY